MKSGSFISLISRVYRVDEKTVTLVARSLKEAGLLTTGARGVNAPNMIPLDAARMTIALLSTDSPAKMVEAVERYRDMKLRTVEGDGNLPAYLFGDGPTLEQVLVRMFGAELDDESHFGEFPYFEIQENQKNAVFKMKNTTVKFRTPEPTAELLDKDRAEHSGIMRVRGLAPVALLTVAAEMWASRFYGADDQGYPLALTHPWNDELRGEKRQRRFAEIKAYVRARDTNWMKGA
ncbi:hypothetical protein [Paracoccus marinaquae]|uniref:Uncharacterized protein n=1 Tax=Paracoccus marinaquae TaxID=2841926 RepID=A0ABS6AEK4_9RHOB|nr:hypothetical protein [Paracoccus marinaquae]MBU3028953.1 hypothetical protein [Paracoccus marinaquae]